MVRGPSALLQGTFVGEQHDVTAGRGAPGHGAGRRRSGLVPDPRGFQTPGSERRSLPTALTGDTWAGARGLGERGALWAPSPWRQPRGRRARAVGSMAPAAQALAQSPSSRQWRPSESPAARRSVPAVPGGTREPPGTRDHRGRQVPGRGASGGPGGPAHTAASSVSVRAESSHGRRLRSRDRKALSRSRLPAPPPAHLPSHPFPHPVISLCTRTPELHFGMQVTVLDCLATAPRYHSLRLQRPSLLLSVWGLEVRGQGTGRSAFS